MSYMIRKAEKEDLPRIYEIYETARQFMRENGNHAQWGSRGQTGRTAGR